MESWDVAEGNYISNVVELDEFKEEEGGESSFLPLQRRHSQRSINTKNTINTTAVDGD